MAKKTEAERDYLIGVNNTSSSETKFRGIALFLLIFLSIACFLGFCETVAAFVRNSHVLGFIFGVCLFLTCAITIVILVTSVKKGTMDGGRKKMIFAMTGLAALLLCFVIMFLTVKIFNYSQPNTNKKDEKKYQFYSSACRNQVQECGKITFQSRVEHTAAIQGGIVWYAQISHTDTFLGLITDGVYTMIPKAYVPSDVPAICNEFGFCYIIRCSKRIGGKYIDCNEFATDFAKCMAKNNNENFNK